MGAADHRAVPSRTPGRRAGGVPAGPDQLADELGLDPGPQLQQLEQQILVHDAALGVPVREVRLAPCGAEPGTCRRCRPSWSDASGDGGAGRSARRRAAGRDRRAGRRRQDGGRDRGRPAAALVERRRPAASGWPGSRRRSTADEVVDTLIAALDVTGGEAALFERLKEPRRAGDPRQLRARRRRGRGARRPPARRRARAADPVHQPGATRRRR